MKDRYLFKAKRIKDGQWVEGAFYIDGDGYVEYENVMAWMPLPEPYKESED